MKKSKKYDAVAAVRQTRERLSIKYWEQPDLLLKDLKAARDKYNIEMKAGNAR